MSPPAVTAPDAVTAKNPWPSGVRATATKGLPLDFDNASTSSGELGEDSTTLPKSSTAMSRSGVGGGGGGGEIFKVKVAFALEPTESVTRTLKSNLPVLPGLPEITPEEEKTSPGGTEPDGTLQA
jgi:hypothetical protein